MFQSERLAAVGLASRRRPNGLVASVMWLGGLVATVAAMAVGAVLAVFTAAAVAVIALFAGVPAATRDAVARQCRWHNYAAHEQIIDRDDDGRVEAAQALA